MNTDMMTNGPPDISDQTSMAEATIGSGQTLQQVKTGYVTAIAVQRPRDIEDVTKRLMREAQHGGETFYYGWAVKGKKSGRIEGPSVGLAIAAARCWGNCAIESQPIQDTGEAWIFSTAFVDLETGFTLVRQYRQSKHSVVAGGMDPERKDDYRFQNGQSKAARNAIIKALPKWLIDRAMDEAKQGVRDKIERYISAKGMAAATDFIVSSLAKQGVGEEQILAKCEVAAIRGLTVDHIVVLKGDLLALQNGEERPEALFPDPGADALKAALAGAAPDQNPTAPATETAREPTNEQKPATDASAEPKADEPEDRPDIVGNYTEELENRDTIKGVRELLDLAQGDDTLNARDTAAIVTLCRDREEAIRGKRGPRSNTPTSS